MKPASKLWSSPCIPLIVALFSPVILEASDPPVIVDLHAHRAEIRAALLLHTPLNSNTSDVVHFISKQLPHIDSESVSVIDGPASGPAAEKEKQRGVKFIRVYLGQYYDHPEVVFLTAPVLTQKEVSADWIFDQHNRLIDIFVVKKTGVY